MSTEPHDGERVDTRAERFFVALLARRRVALVGLALVLALAAAFAARVRPDYDAKGFLPSWDARRVVYEEHAAAFPAGERRLSVFLSAPGSLDVATHARLGRIARALEDEGLEEIQWLGALEVVESDPDDPLGLRVRRPFASDLSDAALSEAFARHRRDPLFAGRAWNAAGTVFAVHATLPAHRDDPEGQLALESSLDERLAPLRAEGADLRVAGLPILKARGLRLVQTDTGRFLGLGVLLVVALLLVVTRRPRDVLAILTALAPAYVVTLAVMGATDTPISALTSFIPLLVLVVGVCDALHLLTHVRDHRRRGAPRRVAIARAFGELLPSCFYTSLTTAIGFLSLLATGVAIVVELAAFTALAVALTFVFAMVLLPLLLDTGREIAVPEDGPIERALDRALAMARAHARRPRGLVLAAFALVALGSLTLATGLRTNGTMIDDVDPAHPLMRDLAWLEAEGFGVHALDLWIRADVDAEGESPLLEPASLAWLERTTRWLDAHAPVRGVVGPGDFLAQARDALGLDGEVQTRQEAAQLFLLLEMARPSLLDEVWRPAEGQAQLSASVLDLGSAEMGPFFDALEAHIARDPPPTGVRVDVTGTLRLAHVTLAEVVSGFSTSLGVAALAVFLLMSWMFRSFRQGLVALVPNTLPLVVLLGAMALFGLDVKPSTLLVFSVAFGIAVDDTLHLLGRFRELLARGWAVEAAIDEALRTSGRAILLTSVVLGLGFSVLLASQFQFLFLVGAMTALSVAFAVLADLFVYPALLRFTARRMPARDLVEVRA
ncbi:MAG: MMPL family transporter [Myxococcales bacterium]|nr:MMPL family transporter [Myxococcales bacterium]